MKTDTAPDPRPTRLRRRRAAARLVALVTAVIARVSTASVLTAPSANATWYASGWFGDSTFDEMIVNLDGDNAPLYTVSHRYDQASDAFVATFTGAPFEVHRFAGPNYPAAQRITVIADLFRYNADGVAERVQRKEQSIFTSPEHPSAEFAVQSFDARVVRNGSFAVDYEVKWQNTDGVELGAGGMFVSSSSPASDIRCPEQTYDMLFTCRWDGASAVQLNDTRRPVPRLTTRLLDKPDIGPVWAFAGLENPVGTNVMSGYMGHHVDQQSGIHAYPTIMWTKGLVIGASPAWAQAQKVTITTTIQHAHPDDVFYSSMENNEPSVGTGRLVRQLDIPADGFAQTGEYSIDLPRGYDPWETKYRLKYEIVWRDAGADSSAPPLQSVTIFPTVEGTGHCTAIAPFTCDATRDNITWNYH